MTTVDDVLIDLGTRPGWAILVITVGVVVGLALIWFIIRSVGTYFVRSAVVGDLPATLILVLALITLVLVVGGLITGSDSAWTVAATGVGAIAASLTSYFQRTNTAIENDRAPTTGAAPGRYDDEVEPVDSHLVPVDEWDDVVEDARSRGE
jgi:hypothetical protein